MTPWDLLLGATLVATITATSIYVTDRLRTKPQEPTRNSGIDHGRDHLSPDFAAPIDAIRCPTAANRSEERRENHGRTLREWIIIALPVLNLYFLHRQVDEMVKVYQPINDQAADARITQSPWVGSPLITAIPSADPTKVYFELTFKNVGKTPTTGMYVGAEISEFDDWHEKGQRHCDIGIRRLDPSQKDAHQATIVPDDSFTISDTAGGEIDVTRSIEEVKRMRQPTLIGCIVYGSPFDKQPHQTIFHAGLKARSGEIAVQHVYSGFAK